MSDNENEINNVEKTKTSSFKNGLKTFGIFVVLMIVWGVIHSCNSDNDTPSSSSYSAPATPAVQSTNTASEEETQKQLAEQAKIQTCNQIEMNHINAQKTESETPIYDGQGTDDHVAREQGIDAGYEDAKKAAGCN